MAQPRRADDEAALTEAIIRLATRFGRYGYRRITALLQAEGWRVNHKRVARIRRREFNTIRPHSSLADKPPAPETFKPADSACAVWRLQPDRPSVGEPLSVP